MPDATNDDIRSIYAAIQEINVKIAKLPTREDLASYVSKEVYNERIESIQKEIDTLKERPNSSWNKGTSLISVVGTIICTCMMVLQFISLHWR